MLNKEDLIDVLNLSCVERYFMAWLNKYYEITKLYNNSYLTIQKVLDDFKDAATYENYNELERIQEISELNKITTHNFYQVKANEALKIIKELKDNELCLIRINNNFNDQYKRKTWRLDHYIAIDNKLNWVNEYPLSIGKFTENEFKENYDNALCIYKLNDLSITPVDLNINKIIEQDISIIKEYPKDLLKLESSIGILRISRKRLTKYYLQNKKLTELFISECQLLDKLYFQIHLKRIKGLIIDFKEIDKKFIELINYEKKIIEELKNEKRRAKSNC